MIIIYMDIINSQFIICYSNFINELKKINEYVNFNLDTDINFETEIKLNEELDDKEKINKGIIFNDLLKKDDDFNKFLQGKYKIFHQDSISNLKTCLFGNNLRLDLLLKNNTDKVKNIIWFHLYHTYISTEYLKLEQDQNSERIKLVFDKLNSKSDKFDLKNQFNKNEIKDNIYNLIGDDLNTTTKEIIDDIINSFDNITNNNDQNDLIPNILNLGQTISDKYSKHIEQNNIDLDQLLQVIIGKIPGMSSILPNIFNASSNKEEKQYIMSDTFSTADIEVGKIEESDSNFKLGDILKMADSLGVIPNKKSKNLNSNILSKDININSLLKVMKNIDNKQKPSDSNSCSSGKNIDINSLLNIIKNIDNSSKNKEASSSKKDSDISTKNDSEDSSKKDLDINSLLDVIKNIDNNDSKKNTSIKLNKKVLKSIKKL